LPGFWEKTQIEIRGYKGAKRQKKEQNILFFPEKLLSHPVNNP